MLPDKEIQCHRRDRTCFDGVVHGKCQLWTNLKGVHPQTGEVTDRYGCADAFVPLLLVEVAQQARQTGAAVESFRNEVVKTNEETVQQRRQALAYVGVKLEVQ